MLRPGFDIFCQVVDNYGDIGVSWRLAKQLARHPLAGPVRLWVDNLSSFARIEQSIDPRMARQQAQGVELIHWAESVPQYAPYGVVIEAFACNPPSAFLARMQDSLWINLEYLSAEEWVEGFHGLPSLQPNGLNKYFFFPGFTEKTGGLLREPGLISAQANWLAQPAQRRQLLRGIGMPEPLIENLLAGWRQAFVFCYGNIPEPALAHLLSRPDAPTVAIVPQGVLPDLRALQSEHFQVFESPFVDQVKFDHLLWSSDLNIVRGEDSLLRAIWAGKPFLWHIYRQDDDAHLVKLNAWLEGTGFSEAIKQSFRALNESADALFSHSMEQALQAKRWMQWNHECVALRGRLASQNSLVERLLEFCAKKSRSG